MKRVAFHHLTLRGFGRYRDDVGLDLDEGPNILVRGNEEGKSTLVAGLLAVLFGLPDWSDTERFGQGRYRNWHGPSRFEGEVEFSMDSVRYRVERGFDDHRIRLLRQDGDAWAEEITGTHNPNARKRNTRYEERLRDLLGISSRELFTATFCITQPLPEGSGEGEAIDADVQRLLSGAGGGSYREALDALAEQLREVTRFSGDRGVHPRNSPQDKRLEQLEREHQELAGRIEGSREAVDALNTVRRGLDDKRRRVADADEKLRLAGRNREALEEWLERRRDWVGAVNEKVRLDRAAEDAERREREWQTRKAALERELPEWPAASGDAGERLEELARREADLAAKGEEMKSVSERLERLRLEAAPASEHRGARWKAALAWTSIPAVFGLVLAWIVSPSAGPAVWIGAALVLGLAGGAAGHLLDAARRSAAAERAARVRQAEIAAQREIWEEQCGKLERERAEAESRIGALRAALEAVLAPAGGDVAEARRRFKRFEELRPDVRDAETAFRNAVAVLGAESVEDLRRKAEGAATKALAARQGIDRLLREHPGLPEPSVDEDPLTIRVRADALRREEQEAEEEREHLRRETLTLREREASLQGREPLNIAVAEEELTRLEEERRRLEREADALTLAHRELRTAAEDYQGDHRERLAGAASERFAAVTGVPGRRVVLDEHFGVSVRESDGHVCAVSQLSQGARDQLYLVLRLAIADLLAGDIRPPFIFDDPFLNCDDERLTGIRRMLEELARERQILILSHREDFVAWGRPVRVRSETA